MIFTNKMKKLTKKIIKQRKGKYFDEIKSSIEDTETFMNKTILKHNMSINFMYDDNLTKELNLQLCKYLENKGYEENTNNNSFFYCKDISNNRIHVFVKRYERKKYPRVVLDI